MAAAAAGDAVRPPKGLTIYIYISLPFLAVAGLLLAIGSVKQGPWDPLGYYHVAMITLMAWGGATLIYCVYLLIANGFVAGNILPGLIVVAAVIGAAVWGFNRFQEDHACRQATAFYEQLAADDPDDRAALIAVNETIVRDPTPCGFDALFYWFGHDRFHPETRTPEDETLRQETLRLLLDHGLVPSEELFRRAVYDADAAFVALLIARRAELAAAGDASWDPTPSEFAFYAVDQIELDPSSVYHQFTPAYRAILENLIAGGLDPCTADAYGKTLAERMERKGVIAYGDEPNCS